MPVNPKSLANLAKRKTWTKGSAPKSPGRPSTADIGALIRAQFAKNPGRCLTQLKRRKVDLWYAYGFGKPAETVNIGGIPGQPLQVDITSGLTIPEMKARLAAIKAKG